jgi:hypothetical protein
MMKFEELPLEVQNMAYKQMADDLLDAWLEGHEPDEVEERLFEALENTPLKMWVKMARDEGSS